MCVGLLARCINTICLLWLNRFFTRGVVSTTLVAITFLNKFIFMCCYKWIFLVRSVGSALILVQLWDQIWRPSPSWLSRHWSLVSLFLVVDWCRGFLCIIVRCCDTSTRSNSNIRLRHSRPRQGLWFSLPFGMLEVDISFLLLCLPHIRLSHRRSFEWSSLSWPLSCRGYCLCNSTHHGRGSGLVNFTTCTVSGAKLPTKPSKLSESLERQVWTPLLRQRKPLSKILLIKMTD
jgi:hypothetical protein